MIIFYISVFVGVEVESITVIYIKKKITDCSVELLSVPVTSLENR